MDTPAALAARRGARWVGAALAALSGDAAAERGLPAALRLAAAFYAGSLSSSEPQLVPRRRLEQLMSSSLRYHLSMVFAEEEVRTLTLPLTLTLTLT